MTEADTPAGAAPFEQTLAQLEALVVRLESGELPLDEALRSFEQGVRLTRECQAALSSAQQKVQLLLQRGETAVLEEFDTTSIEPVSVSATATLVTTGISTSDEA
ncbi:MAG TPA: exodeoxyribonuclease VII small subunit [Steroidobacteraceae bacterium]|jgi:exodeoxyribonuclease VII small subunit|nr:exodeoxyribonuclease VII small subunit [Steroidobacteraceae bacterium]